MTPIITRVELVAALFHAACTDAIPAQTGEPVVLHISPTGADGSAGTAEKPIQSLGRLRERLSQMPLVTEVVFHAGTYRGGLMVDPLKDADPARSALLLRAADGVEVVFDGSGTLGDPTPVSGQPGVFALRGLRIEGEWPRLWESDSRVRYRLVADLAAVAHFAASYTVERDVLYFHTSDGADPKAHWIGISDSDCGIFVNRSQVTVRGLTCRNHLARGKWSCGIDLRSDHITVERCRAWNCSMGFIVTGNENQVRNCVVDDVGNGIYVGGTNARVEGCRLFKERDAFMVPMYAQDDTAIQFYVPAGNGEVHCNLCVGFAQGIFMKPSGAAYRVEHNTVVCSHWGLSHTWWTDQCLYRYNIVVGSEEPILNPDQIKPGTVDFNCYWIPDPPGRPATEVLKGRIAGDHSIIADPRFVNADTGDYRLAADSPCLQLNDAGGPCGAFPVQGTDFTDLAPPRLDTGLPKPVVLPASANSDRPDHRSAAMATSPGTDAKPADGPRTFHVATDGLDTNPGTAAQPWRTLQFAVDRARPGDTILVEPGIHDQPATLTHGGNEGAPIIIRATKKWQAILDGNRQADALIHLEKAPFVEIHDLDIRWYGSAGIRIEHSPNVAVRGCKIWNDFWHGWPTGRAISISFSPGFTGERNVLFRQESGFWLYQSPRARLVHNTCFANLYGAAHFYYSVPGSVCRNNDFAFQGNDVLVIEVPEGRQADLAEFDCDYNNLGTMLRPQPAGTVFDSVTPREMELQGGSKAVIAYSEYGSGQLMRFVSLEEWRTFSGKDRHSIFADPRHRQVTRQQFELEPGSPNLEAGAGGATLGAFGLAEPLPDR